MSRIVAQKCPHCHAPLRVRPQETALRCEYCGHQVSIQQAQQGSAPIHIHLPQGHGPRPPVPRPGKRLTWLLIALPLVLVAGIGGLTYFIVTRVQSTITRHTQAVVQHTTHQATRAVLEQAGGAVAAGQPAERVLWVADAPSYTARVNGDAIDDLILLGRFYGDGDSYIHLVAIDGATGERLWKVGPFGDVGTSSAHIHTKLVLQGGRIVLTDHGRMARVLDPATGRELAATELSDRAEWLCADPEDEHRVWIEVADDEHVHMDLRTAALEPARRRPRWCPRWSERVRCRRQTTNATCVPSRRLARIKGFSASIALGEGAHVVAVGRKSPGTALPMAAGYDARGKEARWSRRLVDDIDAPVAEGAPDHADLAGDRLFVQYEMGKDQHRLLALDAGSGDTLWDQALPAAGHMGSEAEAIVASPTRVFALARGVIYLFDAANGTRTAQAGRAW